MGRATQTALTVWATQTVYTFTAGPVQVNLTFTSPQIASDYNLMSTPSTYVTVSVASQDANTHQVKWYFDVTSKLVLGENTAANITFARTSIGGTFFMRLFVQFCIYLVPFSSSSAVAQAMSIGDVNQRPLSSTADRPTWGVMYLTQSTGTESVLGLIATSTLADAASARLAFVSGSPLPPDSTINPQPAFGGKVISEWMMCCSD